MKLQGKAGGFNINDLAEKLGNEIKKYKYENSNYYEVSYKGLTIILTE